MCAPSHPRLLSVHRHCGMALAGLASDGRQIVERAKYEATSYERTFGEPIPCKELAERVASFMHLCTLFEHFRPFGCGIILGGADRDGPQLYVIEPPGSCYRYFGAAIGYGRNEAKEKIEQLKLSEMTCREGVKEVVKIIDGVQREENCEFQLSWVCDESNLEYRRIPPELAANVVQETEGANTDISGVSLDVSGVDSDGFNTASDADSDDIRVVYY